MWECAYCLSTIEAQLSYVIVGLNDLCRVVLLLRCRYNECCIPILLLKLLLLKVFCAIVKFLLCYYGMNFCVTIVESSIVGLLLLKVLLLLGQIPPQSGCC